MHEGLASSVGKIPPTYVFVLSSTYPTNNYVPTIPKRQVTYVISPTTLFTRDVVLILAHTNLRYLVFSTPTINTLPICAACSRQGVEFDFGKTLQH